MNGLFIADVSELSDTSLFNEAFSYVSEHRKEKVSALRKAEDKRLSLGAGYLFEKKLSANYGLSSALLCFAGGQKEKPRIKGRDDIFYSLSHSGSYALAAISDEEVGADLQEIVHFRESFAKKILSENELSEIYSLPEGKRSEAFIRNWTIKESYMKYTGLGLYLPIRSLEVREDRESGPKLFSSGVEQGDVKFSLFSIPGYCISICSASEWCSQPILISLKSL